MQSPEDTFNELLGLAVVLRSWGARIAEHLSEEAVQKLADAFNRESAYTLQDHSAYLNILDNGPESAGGFEAASGVLRKTLKEGERNVGLIFNDVAAEHHGKYLPPQEYRQSWADKALRHDLPGLQKLFLGQ